MEASGLTSLRAAHALTNISMSVVISNRSKANAVFLKVRFSAGIEIKVLILILNIFLIK